MKFLHALQLQAQALIDMAQRAAALMGEPTHSYAEAGAALARRGVFFPEDLRLYRAVVGFRNVLVHGYISVDTLRISRRSGVHKAGGSRHHRRPALAWEDSEGPGRQAQAFPQRARWLYRRLAGHGGVVRRRAGLHRRDRGVDTRTANSRGGIRSSAETKDRRGGVFAGLGAFLGQRAVSCGRSLLVTRAVVAAMLGSAVYVLLS